MFGRIKQTIFWLKLRKIKKLLINLKEMRWQISKLDGTPLTTDIQKQMQSIIKKRRSTYLLKQRTAQSLSENWQGFSKQPRDDLRFIENAIPVVLSGDNNYAPFMAVMLQSLLDNSNPQRRYHFIIFESNFTKDSKDYLIMQLQKFPHCSIDFINTKNALKDIPFSLHNSKFSTDIFSRFFIPYWLCQYPKVIYCDSDMLAKEDIAKLYDLDIQDYCMGAVANQWLTSVLNRQQYSSLVSFAVFSLLENWHSYINSGLLVFNTKKFKEKFPIDNLLKFSIFYTNHYRKIHPDQDILSLLFENDYFVLPPEWNCCWTPTSKNNEPYYLSVKSNIKIIHFTSYVKPWKDLPETKNNSMAIAYKDYAKNVPLFNDLINSQKE